MGILIIYKLKSKRSIIRRKFRANLNVILSENVYRFVNKYEKKMSTTSTAQSRNMLPSIHRYYNAWYVFRRHKRHVHKRIPQQERQRDRQRARLAAARGAAGAGVLLRQDPAAAGAHPRVAAQVLAQERAR